MFVQYGDAGHMNIGSDWQGDYREEVFLKGPRVHMLSFAMSQSLGRIKRTPVPGHWYQDSRWYM